MQRFPHGAEGSSFFQKRVPESAPEWLQTTIVSTPNGTTSRALVLADMAHVVWAVNLACLGFHVWPYLADRPDVADELRLDLDPQPGSGSTRCAPPRPSCARCSTSSGSPGTRRRRATAGCTSTSGSSRAGTPTRCGPRRSRPRASSSGAAPSSSPRRGGRRSAARRVFVDYNQNAPHKTVFGAWSVRARPGAQVSAPVAWDEVDAVHPDELTIATVPGRLAERGDPWEGIDAEPQSLEPLLELHERDRAAGLMDAPWPPVYPKQPDEPPRVAPSRARKDAE